MVMHFKENVILAIAGLKANKMRALLTMLGIIIGISSVIAIVTLGQAVSDSIVQSMNSLGGSTIETYVSVRPDEYGNVDYSNVYYTNRDFLSVEAVEGFMREYPESVSTWSVEDTVATGEIIEGRNSTSAKLTGTMPGNIEIKSFDMVAGSFLTDEDVEGVKAIGVVPTELVDELFPNKQYHEVLGERLRITTQNGGYAFYISGVYKLQQDAFQSLMMGQREHQVYIPLTLAQQYNGSYFTNLHYVTFKTTPAVTDNQAFSNTITTYFNNTYYKSNKQFYVEAYSMDTIIQQSTDMLGTVSIVISIIAGISLLVGGIGVMNIMLVSVTERTREIGTRKAIGATNTAIRIQFIVESVIICLIGGAIGILLGVSIGRIASILLGFPGWPSLITIIIAVSFSLAIGVFFGYYPANKAAMLDPIEALRYE